MKDNRWTFRCTELQVRDGKGSRGRPKIGGGMMSNNGWELDYMVMKSKGQTEVDGSGRGLHLFHQWRVTA